MRLDVGNHAESVIAVAGFADNHKIRGVVKNLTGARSQELVIVDDHHSVGPGPGDGMTQLV